MAFVATLGQYGFHNWKAPAAPFTLPKEHLETETRPGLDGFVAWKVGSFGDPFNVDTITLVDTYPNSITLKYLYEQLKGGVALTLLFDSEVANYRFLVLDVLPDCKRISHGHVAGDVAVYGVAIHTKWKLAAIPYVSQ